MKKRLGFVLSVLLILSVWGLCDAGATPAGGLSAAPVTAQAASWVPDFTRTGSITVNMHTASGQAIGGGTLTVYQVATAEYDDGNCFFEYTREFADCGLAFDAIETEESGAPSYASALSSYVKDQKLSGTTVQIDSAGKATIGDLALGVYLIVQGTPASGYNAISPFVITVPRQDENGFLYDVNADPKPEAATTVIPTPTPTATPIPPKNLPQTGQLWWPVPVLAAVGLLLFFIGWRRRKKNA